MRTLDRYLAVTVAQYFVLALVTLVAVFSVINATEELQRVGTGRYGVGAALWYVLLTLPSQTYAMFPAAALLGTLVGLGGLAYRHELIAIAAAGVSRARVVATVLTVSAVFAVVAALLNEFVAAPLNYRARTERSVALSNGLTLMMAGGIWTRAGSSFVNMRTLLPDGAARDVYVYDFDPEHRMRRFTYARSATYADRHWTLEGLVDQVIADDGVATEQVAARPVAIEMSPRQLGLMRIPPEELSLADLYRGIGAARRQGESAEHLELAWWQRSTMPLVIVVMVFLAVALVLSALRPVTLGRRVLVGALLGIGFQMFNQTFASFGLVYALPALLTAVLPASLALGVGVWRLSRSP
jgi:lipopolysaccharide export system permease protein